MRKKVKRVESNNEHHYLNRELSWLEFNSRVLEESMHESNPLLERLKFLAIFESNLDEFYMVRVSGLFEQAESGITELSPDGLTAELQIDLIRQKAATLRKKAAQYWNQIAPELTENGVSIVSFSELSPRAKQTANEYFTNEVFTVCSPQQLHPTPFPPFISNRSHNLVVELVDDRGETKLARLKIPPVLPRFYCLSKAKREFIPLEQIIKNNLQHLFPGVKIKAAYEFRVLRDADIEIRELEAADLITSIERTIKMRRFGDPILLQVAPEMPASIRKILIQMLLLDHEDLMEIDSLMDLSALWELTQTDSPKLQFPAFVPFRPENLATSTEIFDYVTKRDLVLYHPFDSFRTVEKFIASAAEDPQVIAIRQTLYRVGEKSPVVESLLAAAEAGKQVSVMVELKARFDESNNLSWARALERAGVHVSYGFAELKTHAKLCLVVRREPGGLKSYAHIGSGNYNPATARLYTDIGLITCRPAVVQDVLELFNYLTGYTEVHNYRKLLVAPINLREGIISRIQREVGSHKKNGKGHLYFKLNSLVDTDIIDELYCASQAGVQVDLCVRGACALRSGVAGLSENIKVGSIVGRFLEHSRIYYFANGGKSEMYIGSADLMRRNLDRRVEALVPIEDAKLTHIVLENVLMPTFNDTENLWLQDSQGEYHRALSKTKKAFSYQRFLMENSLLSKQISR